VALLNLLGIISIFYGSILMHPINIKSILLPTIFILIVKSKSRFLLKYLFLYCLGITILEYIAYYSLVNFWYPHMRFNMYRTFGGFIDIYLNGYFLSIALFLFGYNKLGWIASILSLSFQNTISYLVLSFKNSKIICIILLSAAIYIMNYIGHFSTNSSNSMINSYLALFDYELSECYIIGCASHELKLDAIRENIGLIYDNGVVRTSYFFGLPWLIIYFILILKSSKSLLLPIVFYFTIIHIPIIFGFISTAICAIFINYNNYYNFRLERKLKP
jgi:hypothetical protein